MLNTHEHGDHTGGNKAVIKATGASLLAHANARDKIPGIDRGLGTGDVIKVGATVELEALDTPGHTMSHVCLLSRTDMPALFCGDTLFNAGAGNCHGGGHPAELYETFAGQLARLPDETLIYPGHDYIENNLEFTLDREPDNARAASLLGEIGPQDPDDALVSHARAGEGDQYLLPPAQPEPHRAPARSLPRPARRSGPPRGVPEAARAP